MPLYVGDIGNTLSATLQKKVAGVTSALDLTGATVFFLLEKPSGAVVEVTATPINAKRGQVNYVTVLGDIDEDGVWHWQPRIEFADGSIWHGPADSFEVHEHLVETP